MSTTSGDDKARGNSVTDSKVDTATSKPSPIPKGAGAMSVVVVFFIVGSVLFAAATGKMEAISQESFRAARQAVELAIGLIGIMALWLGLVAILEESGFMHRVARMLRPLLVRLFPDVPPQHPAMGNMVLNISANVLGLGNAATPFGIRAMQQLERLNPFPGTATNAMCLFLALNTSSVTLLPLGVIGVRAAAGSADPAGIFLPTFLATLCSTIVGISIALMLAARDRKYRIESQAALASQPEGGDGVGHDNALADEDLTAPEGTSAAGSSAALGATPYRSLGSLFFWSVLAAFLLTFLYRLATEEHAMGFVRGEFFSFWLMPFLMLLILTHGVRSGLDVYEVVTRGAKQGFEVAVRIIPYLVVILVAIGMFRASGAMELLVGILSPLTLQVHLPAEVLPMAILRPLSGSGAFAVMSALVSENPDAYASFVASVMQGSTETTFYVLAVYFGAVGIVRIRHALVAALCADFTGILAAGFFSHLFFVG